MHLTSRKIRQVSIFATNWDINLWYIHFFFFFFNASSVRERFAHTNFIDYSPIVTAGEYLLSRVFLLRGRGGGDSAGAFRFQDRRLWSARRRERAAERRRESRRHKDSYRTLETSRRNTRRRSSLPSLFIPLSPFRRAPLCARRVGVPFSRFTTI